MATKRRVCVGLILAALITVTVHFKANVLVPTYQFTSSEDTDSPTSMDDMTKDEEKRTAFNHHPTEQNLPLHISKNSHLPTTALSLTMTGTSKSQNLMNDNNSKSPTPPNNGYIMSASYSGWTGGGTGALLQLQCYIKLHALPMQVVEPAVENSKFHAVLNDKTLLFSDLFDISQYNKVLKQDGKYVRLSPWNDFVQKAPRSTIFVKLHFTNTKSLQVECEKGPGTTGCAVPAELKFLETKGFHAVKTLSVFFSTHAPFTAEELKQDILGSWKPDEVTVVLSTWTYSFHIPSEAKSHNPCGGTEWTGRKALYPSERLLKDITRYEKDYQNSQTSVAVLMHAERLIIPLRKESESMVMKTAETHLKELLTTVKELKKKFPNGTTFGAVDVGKFGSLTVPKAFSGAATKYKSRLLQLIQNTLTSVYDNKWTFSEWEDSFLQANGGIADTGYVAAIQRGVASRAKCLVLFGGGRFQFVALNEYVHNHPEESNQCIHQVFVADRFKIRNKQIEKLKQ